MASRKNSVDGGWDEAIPDDIQSAFVVDSDDSDSDAHSDHERATRTTDSDDDVMEISSGSGSDSDRERASAKPKSSKSKDSKPSKKRSSPKTKRVKQRDARARTDSPKVSSSSGGGRVGGATSMWAVGSTFTHKQSGKDRERSGLWRVVAMPHSVAGCPTERSDPPEWAKLKPESAAVVEYADEPVDQGGLKDTIDLAVLPRYTSSKVHFFSKDHAKATFGVEKDSDSFHALDEAGASKLVRWSDIVRCQNVNEAGRPMLPWALYKHRIKSKVKPTQDCKDAWAGAIAHIGKQISAEELSQRIATENNNVQTLLEQYKLPPKDLFAALLKDYETQGLKERGEALEQVLQTVFTMQTILFPRSK